MYKKEHKTNIMCDVLKMTRNGWIHLAVVMDLFSRRIIGWSMNHRIDKEH